MGTRKDGSGISFVVIHLSEILDKLHPILFAHYWYFDVIVLQNGVHPPSSSSAKRPVLKLGQLRTKKHKKTHTCFFSLLKLKEYTTSLQLSWHSRENSQSIYHPSFHNEVCSPRCFRKNLFPNLPQVLDEISFRSSWCCVNLHSKW